MSDKPEFKAIVEKTWVPRHEEFFWTENGNLFYSIEYPGRWEMKIVGMEEVISGSKSQTIPMEGSEQSR